MVRRARKAGSPAPRSSRGARRLAVVLVTLGVAAAVVYGVWHAGEAARRNIGPRDRYEVKFADIRCDPPPGTARDTFLAEVRYAADADPTFQLLDADLVAKLSAAFGAHPWVAGVEGVVVEPPDAVTVKLLYRTPVLAISAGGSKRAVDAKGVLLPVTAPTDGLPELLNAPALPPDATAGKPWPNETVVRAAPVAAEYKPKTMERTEQGWQLVMPDGKKLAVGRQ